MRYQRYQGLGLLFGSLGVAIAALCAVAFFADRVEQSLYQQGAAALAADLVVQQGQPIPADWVTEAERQGLRHSQQTTFPSVIFAQGKPQLVQVKAVDLSYPLRGQLRVRQDDAVRTQAPVPGTVYVDPALSRVLADDSTIPFGTHTLTIAGTLLEVPDASANLFQLAPRVLVNHQDAEASGLLGPASRARYRLLLAGDAAVLADYRAWLTPRLPETSEFLTLENNRPELKNAIERAKRFLSLAALCASLLAGVGILLASRHYVQGLLGQTAILRTLGMTRHQVLWHHAQPLIWVMLAGACVGLGSGYLLQYGLAALLADWFDQSLPAAGWRPIPVAFLQAGVLVGGFALPTLWSVQRIAPMQVLREATQPVGLGQGFAWMGAGLAFAGLLYWQAGDAALAGGIALGLCAMIGVLVGATMLLLQLIQRWRAQTDPLSGIAALQRDPGLTRVQVVSYGVSISLLLFLTLIRIDILQVWQDDLPADTPNHFIINIQPDELAAIQAAVAEQNIPNSSFYPTTRARLAAVNGQRLDPQAYPNPRAKQLIHREYSLGFGDQLQADNQLTDGTWWSPGETGFSVEQELAELLGIQVGDSVQFDVIGQTITAPVANIRKVAWESFNINFFVQGSADLAARVPHAFITSLYLSATTQDFLTTLAQDFPTVSAINIQPLLDKVNEVIHQGTLAIEGVFLFTLAAAGLVSLAAIQISRAQRQREIALLRVLGAGRRQILRNVLGEFAVLGGLAGGLAAALANGLGLLLGEWLFELPIGFNPGLWLIGLGGGIVVVSLFGWFASRPLLRISPLHCLH